MHRTKARVMTRPPSSRGREEHSREKNTAAHRDRDHGGRRRPQPCPLPKLQPVHSHPPTTASGTFERPFARRRYRRILYRESVDDPQHDRWALSRGPWLRSALPPRQGVNERVARHDQHRDLKKGITIELDGTLYTIVDYAHIKMGRGSAQVRLKLRDVRPATPSSAPSRPVRSSPAPASCACPPSTSTPTAMSTTS